MTGEQLPYFGRPPARAPQPAAEAKTLRGRRVILSLPEGFVYDVRAVSDVFDCGGLEVVDVVSEEDYFRWMFLAVPPARSSYPIRLVWLE
ncbi:hypothetical protein [Nocardioides scoriae]|uniref:hypothetical protein n=1 Tax=Nocardioides scoriae TaxID=642780 RepID=UPI000B839021|nr:hypothetical protein [Nocardioides scoriae]